MKEVLHGWQEWNGGERRRWVNKKKEKEPPILRGWPSLWLPLCDVKVAGGARVERVGIIVVYKNMCRLAYNTNGMTALLRSG